MTTSAPQHINFESVDLCSFSEDSRYKFLTGSVVPRPIALVTSQSGDGVLNAAPFSQFIIISVTPPLLGIVAHDMPGGYKDTVRNILASREFVINSVSTPMAAQVQECAVPFPANVSEVAEVGFHTVASILVTPARIAESPLQFECQLHQAIPFGHEDSKTTLIVGEVLLAHCAPGILSGHRIDHGKFSPLGRIAGRAYCTTGDIVHV